MWPAVPAMMFFISTLFILAPLRGQQADLPIVFKTGVADVRVDVQVTQGKELVVGLRKDDFIVTDDAQPQNLVSFEHGDEPVNLLLLFDISASMQPVIEQISQTARQALDHLRPGDRVAIMVFARKTALHQDFSDNLAESARQIGKAVKNWDVGATTQINSAVVEAAHYMEKNATAGRRAILILTDNLSTSYQLTDGQVIRELDKADTVLNAIVTGRAIRPEPPGPSMFPNKDYTPSNVFHVSEETGGEWVKVGEAGETFAEMIHRIRTRYMLTYHAPESQPGTFRHITVALTPDAQKKYPSAEVHARGGYYAQ